MMRYREVCRLKSPMGGLVTDMEFDFAQVGKKRITSKCDSLVSYWFNLPHLVQTAYIRFWIRCARNHFIPVKLYPARKPPE